MRIDITFLGALKKSNIFRVKQHHSIETVASYEIAKFEEHVVKKEMYFEHEILDINNNIIGFYGIDFDNRVINYKLINEKR